jgi:4a-hydroxytetrahydrobiopterin dehydratase
MSNQLLSHEQREAAQTQLSGWTLDDRLRKSFEFADFPSALAFMVRVGFEAERLSHHPNWTNVYNRVEVEIWSHDLGGVSRACVELAEQMDAAARSFERVTT